MTSIRIHKVVFTDYFTTVAGNRDTESPEAMLKRLDSENRKIRANVQALSRQLEVLRSPWASPTEGSLAGTAMVKSCSYTGVYFHYFDVDIEYRRFIQGDRFFA